MPHAIILFDGTCLLCDGLVRRIIAADPRGYFRFAPLQSEAARRLLGERADDIVFQETMVVIENGAYRTRSDAALRIARRLRMPWPLLSACAIIPKPLRDAVYRWVAHNRHAWFGKREPCPLPTPEQRERFIL